MKILLQVMAIESVLAGVFLAAAGRWDVPWFWALIAVHTVAMVAIQGSMDPDLKRERWRPGPGARDRWVRLVASGCLLLHLTVAGLDVGRFGWSSTMPTWVHGVAMAVYLLGLVCGAWAMRVNRFFSSAVRIQRDRGHRVVSDGPYRFLRHPGYVSVMVAAVSGGILMGSWWSIAPLVPLIALFVWRTSMEDRVLRAELEGYEAYASGVRYRLVPGLW